MNAELITQKKTERLSIFDIFKVGVGPSSSHTLGPWRAALAFIADLGEQSIDRIEVDLYGSLSQTGKGHATDVAVILGLEGFDPETIDTSKINAYLERINTDGVIQINGKFVPFTPSKSVVFKKETRPEHPNTLTFAAYKDGKRILTSTYYSVGGGFIEKEGEEDNTDGKTQVNLAYPIDSGKELLEHTEKTGWSIAQVVEANEKSFRSEEAIDENIKKIFNAMMDCVYRGCHTEGILPGGLNVKRRAKKMKDKLMPDIEYTDIKTWFAAIQELPREFNLVNKFVSCFALAVNEENAALGRVVTSPTNGAAGVIPAVLLYFHCFCEKLTLEQVRKFYFSAGEVGCLFKKGATISAAVGGCQAEIGVSSAMAAAGLTELLGGSPRQVLMAAEIAMEHHLGLTCDPIGGLVQIPCIERNTMGAMKAITASNLALSGDPEDAIVNFDVVVKTMWDTARDMNGKYKETSEGGLAYNLPVILPEC